MHLIILAKCFKKLLLLDPLSMDVTNCVFLRKTCLPRGTMNDFNLLTMVAEELGVLRQEKDKKNDEGKTL